MYSPKTKDVTAKYEVYNGTDAALPASGGVANSALSAVASASTGKPSQAVCADEAAAFLWHQYVLIDHNLPVMPHLCHWQAFIIAQNNGAAQHHQIHFTTPSL